MSEQMQYVMKIGSALSNKPLFVKLERSDMSIDHVITEAIDTLKNLGKPLESQQLEQLYSNHQLYNSSQVVEKGTLFSELEKSEQKIGDVTVQVVELNLVTRHSGGVSFDSELV